MTTNKLPAHSKLSASGNVRWMNCPGSVKLSELFPQKEAGEAAEEGTGAHALGEKVLLNAPNAFYYVGREKFNGFDVTDEMAEGVQLYCDHVVDVRNELGGELTVEEKFHLKHLHPLLFGTADAVIRQEFGKLVVIDFKFGVVPVEVERNTQLMEYALGAAYGGDYEEIELHVVQPRAPHSDGPIRKWSLSYDELVEWGKELKAAAIATEKENAPLNAGDWCKWCPAAGGCPKLGSKALSEAQIEFDDMNAPKLPDVLKLSDEQMVRIIQHEDMLKKFIQSVKDLAQMRLEAGEKIEGVKLVKGRKSRKWRDEKEAIAALGEEIFERRVRTVANAEKLFGKSVVADFVVVEEGKLSVAHESDRRQGVQLAHHEFNQIDDGVSVEDF